MSADDSVRRIGGALGWGVAARGARLGLGLIGTALVLRGLGPYEYGVLAVVRTVIAYAVIMVGAGLGQAILRYVPQWRVGGERGRVAAAIRGALGFQLLLWLITLGVLLVTRPVWNGWAGPGAGLLVLGIALLLPEVSAQTAGLLASAYYDARHQSAAVVVSTIVHVAGVYILLERGLGASGVLVAAAISNFVLTVMLLLRVPSYLAEPAAAAPPEAETPGYGRALRYSLPFVAIGVLNLITWRQSEVLFLGHFRSAREAGFFDLAYRLPQTVLEFVPGAIWPLVMAGSSEAYVRDPVALQRTSGAYYKLLFLIAAPLAVGGVLTGDLLVRIVGGEAYATAGSLCQVFFVIFGISFLATPLSMAFYVLERPWVGFWIYVVNATVNVGLDLVLIPRYGLWGAVIPVSLVIAASPWVNQWVLARLGIRITPPWGFLGRITGAAAVMLLLWPLRGVAVGIWGFLGLTALGAILFVLAVRWFRVFGPEEHLLMERASPVIWGRIRPILVRRVREA